jgi:hypothetical protein
VISAAILRTAGEVRRPGWSAIGEEVVNQAAEMQLSASTVSRSVRWADERDP